MDKPIWTYMNNDEEEVGSFRKVQSLMQTSLIALLENDIEECGDLIYRNKQAFTIVPVRIQYKLKRTPNRDLTDVQFDSTLEQYDRDKRTTRARRVVIGALWQCKDCGEQYKRTSQYKEDCPACGSDHTKRAPTPKET